MKLQHKAVMVLGIVLCAASLVVLFYTLLTNGDISKYSPPIIALATLGAVLALKSAYPTAPTVIDLPQEPEFAGDT